MSSKPKPKPADLSTLISITKTTRDLLKHFQSSLTASSTSPPNPSTTATNNNNADPTSTSPNPLTTLKTTTTLLKSHTTTLSLLLLTPPLTPSALLSKLSSATTGALTAIINTITTPPPPSDSLGAAMRAELRAQVRRLLGAWDDLLAVILRIADARTEAGIGEGLTEKEKEAVLAATGVVWEDCDGLVKVCEDGVVGFVVGKAEALRGVLMDALQELREWGEDVGSDDDDEDEGVEGSGDEDDEDEMFWAGKKLRKGDTGLKEVLDKSLKKLKMVGMLYQALIKRRLKTLPKLGTSITTENGDAAGNPHTVTERLDQLMALLQAIPESVDELASAFYELDEEEAKQILSRCCGEAKTAAELVKQGWGGQDDEFTAWSAKWVGAMEAA